MTIGQVAVAAGFGAETIRFYEKQGLLEEPARRASGYRDYDRSVVTRLLFIRRAKELGFTLKEIKDLLSLRVARKASCGTVKRRAESKIADIDAKLRTLRGMRRALQELVANCELGDTSAAECPILEALEGELRL
jgi:Cu(I)-responsive transcriptional regulator